MNRKSEYKVNGKYLHEMSNEELLDAVETIWKDRTLKMEEAEARARIYETMLQSPLPVHSIWRQFAENVVLIVAFAFIISEVASAIVK